MVVSTFPEPFRTRALEGGSAPYRSHVVSFLSTNSIEILDARRLLPRSQAGGKIVSITEAPFLKAFRDHVGRLIELTHPGAIDIRLEAERREQFESEGYETQQPERNDQPRCRVSRNT